MKNQIKTIVLLGILSAILVWIGGFLRTGYLYLFTAIALLMNLGAYFYSDRIVLAVQGAKEITPQQAPDLHALAMALERLSRSAERIPSHTEPAMASLFIVNPFAGTEGLKSLFSTHPPVRLRIRRLRELSNSIMRVPTKSAA